MTDDICKQVGQLYDMEDCFWKNETYYDSFHNMRALGYVDLTCTVIATISNAIVIMVFSRKSVASSMSTIFTHVAISESLAGLCYAPRAWHEFFHVADCAIPQHRTFFWEVVSLGSYMAAFMFRHIGVWLALMLGVWRYIAVIHPLKERQWCNLEMTRKFIKLGYAFGAAMMIPINIGARVGSAYKMLDKNGCSTSNNTIGNQILIYEFQVRIETVPAFYMFSFYFYGLFLKLLPATILSFTSYRLIVQLIEMRKQRGLMISQQQGNNSDRTTRILVLILALFVVAEVPHGIFCLLAAYHGPAFFWRFVYRGFEISTTITHLSECFNFIIYYAMSKEFRKTFKAMIRCEAYEYGSQNT